MIDELRRFISPEVRQNEPLAPHTTFRIGGPAEYYFEAKTADDVVRAIRVCEELKFSHFILGGGSNLLIADEGVKGLVIRLANQDIVIEGQRVKAGAGAPLGAVALKAAQANLTGFEWAGSVPGTLGGAIRGNAGCFGSEMKDAVVTVTAVRGGQVIELANADCGFGYRTSVFKQSPGTVIVAATLELKPGQGVEAGLARMKEMWEKKKATQPLEFYSAGCVFMNYQSPDDPKFIPMLRKALDLNKEEQIPFTPDGRIPVGWMIDRAQLKGWKLGPHVHISEQHGNFIVNDGQGTASEVVQLTAAIKMKLRDLLHGELILMDEIEYVGF